MVKTSRWLWTSVIVIAAVLIAAHVEAETIRSILLGTFVVLCAISIAAETIACAVQSGWRYGAAHLVLVSCALLADVPTPESDDPDSSVG